MYQAMLDDIRAKERELEERDWQRLLVIAARPAPQPVFVQPPADGKPPQLNVASMVQKILRVTDLQGPVRERIAERLAMSAEGLRYHLVGVGTSFGELLLNERRRRVEEHLACGRERTVKALVEASGWAHHADLRKHWPDWFGCEMREDRRLKKGSNDTYRGLWD